MAKRLPTLTKHQTPDAWRRALDVAEGYLIGVARSRQVTTYADVGAVVAHATGHQIRGHTYRNVLGEISERSAGNHGVLLSAVVVAARDWRPGKGFAKLARKLGLGDSHLSDEGLEQQLLADVWRKFAA